MAEKVIDFHTHAFSDDLAPRAMKTLTKEAPDVKAYLNGTVSALLGSMNSCGIEKSVICCIATRPAQFEPIFRWCRQIRSEKLVPFPSIHPEDPECMEKVGLIKTEGFKGIKLHPFYQNFYADEERMFRIYEKICREELLLVMHTGFDIAFPRIRRVDAEKILKVKRNFPNLKLITTHLGAWQQWDEVEKLLIGKEIYMEISFALEYLEVEVARRMILEHPEGYVLFGTDSPWTDQNKTLSLLKRLQLPEKRQKQILSDNALGLLGF
jgi:predicted TIM-barrel fold metal-dependent hydrolase